MGFNKRKMEDQRAEAARKEAEARRELDAQVLEDAERLVAIWNERQAHRMPMLFSPTIGAAIRARFCFLWVRCPAPSLHPAREAPAAVMSQKIPMSNLVAFDAAFSGLDSSTERVVLRRALARNRRPPRVKPKISTPRAVNNNPSVDIARQNVRGGPTHDAGFRFHSAVWQPIRHFCLLRSPLFFCMVHLSAY